MSLPNKVAIITGGTKGLGKAISIQFGKAGFYVIALYKKDSVSANALQAEFADLKIQGKAIPFDISANTTAEFEQTVLGLPEISENTELVLVNNAVAPFHPNSF